MPIYVFDESDNGEQLKKAFKNKVKNTSTTKLSELDATGDSIDLEDDDKKKPKKPMPIYVFDESNDGEQLKKAFKSKMKGNTETTPVLDERLKKILDAAIKKGIAQKEKEGGTIKFSDIDKWDEPL